MKRSIKRLKVRWTCASSIEVTKVSEHCFRLRVGTEEFEVPFIAFPWFRTATLEQLVDVQNPTEDHLYWPQLDLDVSVDSIRNPKSFPLVSSVRG